MDVCSCRRWRTGQALSEEQREYFTAAFVEEQILVQEALKIGLDDDARIHDILAQKMRHVLSGDIIQPSEAELEAFYQANLERYRTLPTLDTDEIVFNSRETLPSDLLAQLAAGAEAESCCPSRQEISTLSGMSTGLICPTSLMNLLLSKFLTPKSVHGRALS